MYNIDYTYNYILKMEQHNLCLKGKCCSVTISTRLHTFGHTHRRELKLNGINQI